MKDGSKHEITEKTYLNMKTKRHYFDIFLLKLLKTSSESLAELVSSFVMSHFITLFLTICLHSVSLLEVNRFYISCKFNQKVLLNMLNIELFLLKTS